MDNTIDIEGTAYSYDKSQTKNIEILAERVRELRKDGKMTPQILEKIRGFFKIKNIYHSNAIEGNILDIGETKLVVQEGLTISGKPLKDQAEAKNLSEALDFLEMLVKDKSKPITAHDIRQLHYFILKDIDEKHAGTYRNIPVKISGSQYTPPNPENVNVMMSDFDRWLSGLNLSPDDIGNEKAAIYAAAAHTWLVYIHPFVDGNGRVARLLMNLILMRYGYPIAVISREDRYRYYDALEESQSSDLSAFISLLTECVHESLEEYETAVRENREMQEWAQSLAEQLAQKERNKYRNEYEVWKSAMDLLKYSFRQTSELLNQKIPKINIFFKDFGDLEFEKYYSLKSGDSVKRTWFFRLDFVSSEKARRYLFFFGYPGIYMKDKREIDVTIHLSFESPPNSFFYQRIDEYVLNLKFPLYAEFGYAAGVETYLCRKMRDNKIEEVKANSIVKSFFDSVIENDFA